MSIKSDSFRIIECPYCLKCDLYEMLPDKLTYAGNIMSKNNILLCDNCNQYSRYANTTSSLPPLKFNEIEADDFDLGTL